MDSSRLRIISIDANIGAGKTTVLEFLRDKYSADIDVEPVDKWQPWLERMYKGGTGVFEFQLRVWLDRCWPTSAVSSSSMYLERSPFFQLGVFVPANINNGKMSYEQAILITEMYDKVMSIWEPEIYVYLRSDPAKCAERIIRRGRTSEDNIPITYLKELHDLHEQSYDIAVAKGKKVVVIDVEGKTVEEIATEIAALS